MSEIPYKVNSLQISNISIINKSEDPRIFGYSSLISSLYFRNNGEVYQKFDTGDMDWELVHPREVKNITSNYSILRTNSNLTIDSTSGNIVLSLPDVTNLYKGKEFYFKKISTYNIVTINPFSGQTIDGNSSATLTDLNESLVLIYVDTNNWTSKSSGTTSAPSNYLTLTNIKTTNYSANINELVLINSNSGTLTVTLPNTGLTIGDRIGIKDTSGFISDSTKRLLVNPNGKNIHNDNSTLTFKDSFIYLEFIYSAIDNWDIVNKAKIKDEFLETDFKIFSGTAPSNQYLNFSTRANQTLTLKSPVKQTGIFTLGNIPLFSVAESYSIDDFVEYNYNIYKCSANHLGAWDYNNFDLISNRERVEILINQTSHGFTFGNLIKYSTTWQKAQSNNLTSYCLGIVSEVIDTHSFKLCFSGYLSGFTGLTINTLYYLSETSAGDYTSVKSDILKQPVFFSLSSTEAIILPWSPSLEDFLQNTEYIISNNGVLNFTTKSGFYKVIEKNNVLNELDIKYSIGNSFVDLVVKNMSNLFSDIKDTTTKVNIYVETATIKIQNLSGSMKTFIIKKII